jgi:hypothetical protein
LFYEMCWNDDAIYTMKETDHEKGFPSFRRIYLEIADPTEYRQANELVGGWEHWQALCASKWFTDYIEGLREELEVKLKSEAVLNTYLIMEKQGNSSLPAAKMILDGVWKPKRGKGRPSKQEVEAEARKQAAIQRRVANDAERL